MGRHHTTPSRRTARLVGAAGLTAGALTYGLAGAAWAGDTPEDPEDVTTTECGALEPGDALIAAPVCAPVDVVAPLDAVLNDTADLDLLDDVDELTNDLLN